MQGRGEFGGCPVNDVDCAHSILPNLENDIIDGGPVA